MTIEERIKGIRALLIGAPIDEYIKSSMIIEITSLQAELKGALVIPGGVKSIEMPVISTILGVGDHNASVFIPTEALRNAIEQIKTN